MKRKPGLIILAVAAFAIVSGLLLAPSFVSRPVEPHAICRSNLYQIKMAKQMYAKEHALITNDTLVTDAILVPDQLSTNYIKHGFVRLHCPEGGSYSIGRLSEDPMCSSASQDERHSIE